MKNIILLVLFATACTIEVPVDEIEIPPIENTTQIVLNVPDGFFNGNESNCYIFEVTEKKAQALKIFCEFKELPDYSDLGGYLAHCKSHCCYWKFPESNQICEEKWCLNLDDKCGWEMISWHCKTL